MVDIKKEDMQYAKQRISKMKTERTKIEQEWLTAEQQYDAPSYTDNDGKIIYNSKMESTLSEQHIGRLANQIYFDFKPEQEADAQEVYASKAITSYFLEKEGFYRQLSMRDHAKSIYGLGIRYCGISLELEKKFKPKEGAEVDKVDVSGGIDDDSLFEEYTQYNRSFTPKNVSVRDFYRDDRYFRQPDWNLVEDCYREEYISKDKLQERRGENKKYDISGLQPTTYTDKSGTTHNDCIKIGHYYNKNTKDYIIFGNDEKEIRGIKMKYKNGKLPFEVAQHYPDNKCIAGKGIPYKVRSEKGYYNNIMQASLDKARSSAFSNIVLGQNNVLNDRYTVGGGVNIREMNSTADFQQYQTNGDLNGMVAVMEMINENVRQNTGEDPKASFESPEQTLGQTEIIEENKAIRLKAIQISRDLCLDNVITFCYNNIQQFAPVLLRTTQTIGEGYNKITKVIRPKIGLPGIKVVNKLGKQIMEENEDYGEMGWYELNPKYRMIDGTVKIVTNSSYNKQGSVLEKNKFTEMVNNMVNLTKIYGPQVIEKFPLEDIIAYQNQAYGYDNNGKFASKTKKDKIREENLKMIEKLKAKMGQGILQYKSTNEAIQPQNPSIPQIPGVGGQMPEDGGTEQPIEAAIG